MNYTNCPLYKKRMSSEVIYVNLNERQQKKYNLKINENEEDDKTSSGT